MTVLLKSPTVKGFTANNLRGSVRYLRRRLERRIARGSAAAACLTDRTRLRGSGLLDGSLGGRRGVRGGSRGGAWFETGPAACQTARSCRFGGGFDSRRARHFARRLARGVSADGSRRAQRLARRLARGASADGSVETDPVSCPAARSRRFGGWFGREGPGVLPGGSLDNTQGGRGPKSRGTHPGQY